MFDMMCTEAKPTIYLTKMWGAPFVWNSFPDGRKSHYLSTDGLCLSVCLSVYVCLSGCIYVCVSVCLYMSLCCLPACLSVSLFVFKAVCLPLCLPVCLSNCLSVYLSVCLSMRLSICLSVFLSVWYSLADGLTVQQVERLYVCNQLVCIKRICAGLHVYTFGSERELKDITIPNHRWREETVQIWLFFIGE